MSDHKKELMLIKDLMDKLVDEMEYSPDDLAERLGRKPAVKSVEVQMEGELPMGEEDEALERAEELTGQDLDDDMEMGEDPEHAEMVLGEEEPMSPEEKLKQRILKMRG